MSHSGSAQRRPALKHIAHEPARRRQSHVTGAARYIGQDAEPFNA